MRPQALLIQGDARHLPLRDVSVQCVVTSPPYWGLRDYGLLPLVWDDPGGCEHEWGEQGRSGQRQRSGADCGLHEGRATNKLADNITLNPQTGAFCSRCSAWRGVLGLEPTSDLYVQHLVEIFREVKRVLRDDGTVWLNLGDSYASGDRSTYRSGISDNKGHLVQNDQARPRTPSGLKPKDLVGIPWRVAFALQADGWWLRSDIIWSKPNPMPESVTDRPTKSHEYLFLLSKSATYYYDAKAIKEEAESYPGKMPDGWDTGDGAHGTIHRQGREKGRKQDLVGDPRYTGFNARYEPVPLRSRRTVWEIATAPFPEAHFATFPSDLVKPCVLAGTSERGACAGCGGPWERQTETEYRKNRPSAGNDPRSRNEDRLDTARGHGGWQGNNLLADVKTLGWRPTCACEMETTRPCLVLDPFAGAGTVPLVAQNLGRVGIGVELKGEYLAMAQKRTAQMGLM